MKYDTNSANGVPGSTQLAVSTASTLGGKQAWKVLTFRDDGRERLDC